MSLEDLTADQLLAKAREMESSHALFTTLTKNPETREMLQRALKKAKPDLVIPEIDAADKVMAALAEERKERQSLESKIIERDTRDRLEKDRARAMTEYGLTEAEVLECEKLMLAEKVEERFPSYKTAAQYIKASRQSAEPTPSSIFPPTYTMPEKDVWGKGIGNPSMLNKIAMDQAFAAWNEISSGKVAGAGPAK